MWYAVFVLRGPLFTETLDSVCLSKVIIFSSHLHSFEIGSWYVAIWPNNHCVAYADLKFIEILF